MALILCRRSSSSLVLWEDLAERYLNPLTPLTSPPICRPRVSLTTGSLDLQQIDL